MLGEGSSGDAPVSPVTCVTGRYDAPKPRPDDSASGLRFAAMRLGDAPRGRSGSYGGDGRMADGSGKQDEPECDWLYGKSPESTTRQRSRSSSRPDPTMPTQIPVQQQPAYPPPQREPTPAHTRRRSRRPPGAPPQRSGGGRMFGAAEVPAPRVVLVLLALWLVYLVAVPFFAWTKVDKVEFEPDGDRPADQPGTTYLMVGSDSRGGLTEEERKELSTGNAGGSAPTRSCCCTPGRAQPADVDPAGLDRRHPRPRRRHKINAAYAFGGPHAAGRDDRERDRHPDRRLRRDRLRRRSSASSTRWAASRSAPSRRSRTAKLASLRHQEGLPGGRRRGRARLRPVPARPTRIGDLDRARPSARWSPRSGARRALAVDRDQPVPLLALNMAIPEFFAFGEGMGPIRRGDVGHGDDQGRRRRRAHLRGADRGPGGALGPRARPSRCSRRSSRTTPTASTRSCAPTAGLQRP